VLVRVTGTTYVAFMKPLPAIYAMTCVGDRWLAVAPDERAMHGRTFDRLEIATGSREAPVAVTSGSTARHACRLLPLAKAFSVRRPRL